MFALTQNFIFIQSEDSTNPTYFFNIYNALEPGTEFDLDKLARKFNVHLFVS